MNLKAIIASLVLGSSSVAMAAPSVSVKASYGTPSTTTIVRDHRAPVVDDCAPAAPAAPVHTLPAYSPPAQPVSWSPPIWRQPAAPQPLTMASGAHFASNGRVLITNPAAARQFSSLKVSAAGGRTFIQQVTVEFNNGQTQTMRNLNATLTGNQSVTLDLDGDRRGIRRVVVQGKALGVGWQRSASAFTLTAV